MAGTTNAKTGTGRTRATKAKTAVEDVAVVEESATATTPVDTVENADADVVENDVEEVVEEKKVAKSKTVERPLGNDEEIEVVALIPNVSYRDFATSDYYEWKNAGDVEYMTVEALARMRRNYKSYFDNMCLKPMDERVIKKFGLGRLYSKFDEFMDASNYTRDNITNLLDGFSSMRNSMKNSIVTKIKDMAASGEISDVTVLRTIEKRLGIDLIEFL